MFGYTRYSRKTEHLQQLLHTNKSQINTPMFVMWLKPSRGKLSTALPNSYLEQFIIQIERKLHELVIIDQLAKDPPCSLNRDH